MCVNRSEKDGGDTALDFQWRGFSCNVFCSLADALIWRLAVAIVAYWFEDFLTANAHDRPALGFWVWEVDEGEV